MAGHGGEGLDMEVKAQTQKWRLRRGGGVMDAKV